MPREKTISGFSKLDAAGKLQWMKEAFDLPESAVNILNAHLHPDNDLQAIYNEFSENTVSNFYIPFGLAPNFLINGKWYVIPMAIEESSVVAAASHAAKFWSAHGGFHAEIPDQVKIGQVHFFWNGDPDFIKKLFENNREKLINLLKPFTASMEKRGGGIKSISLVDRSKAVPNYYQLHVQFMTADAMGANFINTVLENLASEWKELVAEDREQATAGGNLEINMAILSNYTPECRVKISCETHVDNLSGFDKKLSGRQFAEKFVRATEVALGDTYRAVTHNKGIFNGMDAVVIATGNDFRAVEACGHAYAARDGQYRSLSSAEVNKDTFSFTLDVPMAVGTVGGLTTGHPLAAVSLKMLGNPDASELMTIISAAGLANNFSAVRSLVTKGIQAGHMKMHLTNILRQLGANDNLREKALAHFRDKVVSYSAVKEYLDANTH